ncbi:PTS sugar transporter subunit IIA [Martelella alba]|uniref:PTS sugar transporter subunit IIA n=1 Tax=Martelella alba TaxID=2590451 RepID=A0ABY2SI73_9HYPH|nr:PTS sugar transporter subunit IIA [Martelella alba]TKI04467.1 PTS sugar transporter subunit IIA [Martelella alba]
MLFDAKRIFTLDQVDSRNALLARLADSLYRDGCVRESFLTGVLEREAVYPTGIDMETHSVAIPHTEFEHVVSTGFAIAINRAGIQFHRSDDPDSVVQPAVVVLMAIDPTCEKVAVIQSLFALLADIEQVNKITQNTPEENAKLFTAAIATR